VQELPARDFFACQTSTEVTGITYDGGYAEYMVAPVSAVALTPENLNPVESAPLMCAGVTTFNALRNSGARRGGYGGGTGVGRTGAPWGAVRGEDGIPDGGDRAAGRLRSRWRKKWGVEVHRQPGVGPGGGTEKTGRAKVVLATVTAGDAMAATFGGLGANGKLDGFGRATFAGGFAVPVDLGQTVGGGLVFGDFDRLGGDAGVQRTGGREVV
jgi:hypothetical protein